MRQINPLLVRLFPKLAYQLVPAAMVTTVGVLLLSNLSSGPDTTPPAASVETPINAEAVFRIVPREQPTEAPAKAAAARPASNPKPLAANVPTPPRKPVNDPAAPRQAATAPAPLQIVQVPEQAQTMSVTAAATGESTVMTRLRSTTAAVQQIPQWAARSVAGWFAADLPPRPPAPVPGQNFQASM